MYIHIYIYILVIEWCTFKLNSGLDDPNGC